MAPTTLPIDKPTLRGLDTNSLLRLFDRTRPAGGAFATALDRERVEKVHSRVAAELRRRGVRV
jgi:hypothetical protein